MTTRWIFGDTSGPELHLLPGPSLANKGNIIVHCVPRYQCQLRPCLQQTSEGPGYSLFPVMQINNSRSFAEELEEPLLCTYTTVYTCHGVVGSFFMRIGFSLSKYVLGLRTGSGMETRQGIMTFWSGWTWPYVHPFLLIHSYIYISILTGCPSILPLGTLWSMYHFQKPLLARLFWLPFQPCCPLRNCAHLASDNYVLPSGLC